MSDFAPLSTPAPLTPPAEEAVTGGLLLRRARQAAGLHPEALAASLKVPVQKIEALEADRFDLLPDLVFVRALAASVCRTLEIDPRPVLERLPRKGQPRLAQDRDRVNAPFRSSNEAVTAGWRDRLMRPPVLAMLALLLGALVLVLLPQSLLDQATRLVQQHVQEPPAPVRAAAPEAASVTLPATAASLAATPAEPIPAEPAAAGPASASPPPKGEEGPAATATAGAAASSLAPAVAQVAGAAMVPPESGSPAPVAAPADSAGVLVFRATGESWIEVRDAQGTVALRRMLAAGETADASGTPPLSVTVGKVDVTQLQVRGREFDLAAVARDNVARFQVK